MNCPNCLSKFNNVVLKSHYGADVEVEQCPLCGGIWCDGLEMHSISISDAKQHEKIDLQKLIEPAPIGRELNCPRCHVLLKEFKDPNFPEQIKLDFCSKCEGFWLNRGELSEFKEWQNNKILAQNQVAGNDNKKLSTQIDALLDSKKNNSFEMWGKIGNALNQQVEYNNPEIESLFGAVWLIVRILRAASNYLKK